MIIWHFLLVDLENLLVRLFSILKAVVEDLNKCVRSDDVGSFEFGNRLNYRKLQLQVVHFIQCVILVGALLDVLRPIIEDVDGSLYRCQLTDR